MAVNFLFFVLVAKFFISLLPRKAVILQDIHEDR